jgi:ERCC4-type nuclease
VCARWGHPFRTHANPWVGRCQCVFHNQMSSSPTPTHLTQELNELVQKIRASKNCLLRVQRSPGGAAGSCEAVAAPALNMQSRLPPLPSSEQKHKPLLHMFVSTEEHHLLREFDRLGTLQFVSTQRFYPGDVVFAVDGSPVLVVERKRVDDLIAHIGSSYRQQKAKLAQLPLPRAHVWYLLERHSKFKQLPSKQRKMLESCRANTSVRDGMRWCVSDGIAHSALILLRLFHAVQQYGWYTPESTASFHQNSPDASVDHLIHTATKNVTRGRSVTGPERAFVAMLSCIKGCSTQTACTVQQEHYPSMGALVKAYQRTAVAKRARLLADIPLGPATSKKRRRVGPSLSLRIYEALGGDSIPST